VSVHMFIGMVLIPPIALKLGSTGYRFVRYYTDRGPIARRERRPSAAAAGARAGGDDDCDLRHRTVVDAARTPIGPAAVLPQAELLHLGWPLRDPLPLVRPVDGSLAAEGLERGRPACDSGSGWRGMLVAASLGGGLALAVALLSVIDGWHGRRLF